MARVATHFGKCSNSEALAPTFATITFVDADARAGVSAIGACYGSDRAGVSAIGGDSALDHSQVIGDQTFYFSRRVSRRRSL